MSGTEQAYRLVTYSMPIIEGQDEPDDWRARVASGEAETYSDETIVFWQEG